MSSYLQPTGSISSICYLLKHIPGQPCQEDSKDLLVEAKRWDEEAKRVIKLPWVRANADNAIKKAIMWE